MVKRKRVAIIGTGDTTAQKLAESLAQEGDIMEKSGLECCLNIAARSYEGLGWSIPKEWADELVKQKKLNLECRLGDMTGEKSALFDHNGVTLRLKLRFPGRWQILKGDWKPDPHWRGD